MDFRGKFWTLEVLKDQNLDFEDQKTTLKDQNLDFGMEKIKINNVDAIGIINRSTYSNPIRRTLLVIFDRFFNEEFSRRTLCLVSTPRSQLAPITLVISKNWMWWSKRKAKVKVNTGSDSQFKTSKMNAFDYASKMTCLALTIQKA